MPPPPPGSLSLIPGASGLNKNDRRRESSLICPLCRRVWHGCDCFESAADANPGNPAGPEGSPGMPGGAEDPQQAKAEQIRRSLKELYQASIDRVQQQAADEKSETMHAIVTFDDELSSLAERIELYGMRLELVDQRIAWDNRSAPQLRAAGAGIRAGEEEERKDQPQQQQQQKQQQQQQQEQQKNETQQKNGKEQRSQQLKQQQSQQPQLQQQQPQQQQSKQSQKQQQQRQQQSPPKQSQQSHCQQPLKQQQQQSQKPPQQPSPSKGQSQQQPQSQQHAKQPSQHNPPSPVALQHQVSAPGGIRYARVTGSDVPLMEALGKQELARLRLNQLVLLLMKDPRTGCWWAETCDTADPEDPVNSRHLGHPEKLSGWLSHFHVRVLPVSNEEGLRQRFDDFMANRRALLGAREEVFREGRLVPLNAELKAELLQEYQQYLERVIRPEFDRFDEQLAEAAAGGQAQLQALRAKLRSRLRDLQEVHGALHEKKTALTMQLLENDELRMDESRVLQRQLEQEIARCQDSLQASCERGDLEAVKGFVRHVFVLRRKAWLNTPDPRSGRLPLHVTAEAGWPSVVSYLLAQQADPSLVEPPEAASGWGVYGGNALELACVAGHLPVAEAIWAKLSGARWLQLVNEGSAVATLVVAGVSGGGSSSGLAASDSSSCASNSSGGGGGNGNNGGSVAVVSGFGPVHLAVQQGHPELLAWLLARGGRPDQPAGRLALTPLHLATQYGDLECLEVLMAALGLWPDACRTPPHSGAASPVSQQQYLPHAAHMSGSSSLGQYVQHSSQHHHSQAQLQQGQAAQVRRSSEPPPTGGFGPLSVGPNSASGLASNSSSSSSVVLSSSFSSTALLNGQHNGTPAHSHSRGTQGCCPLARVSARGWTPAGLAVIHGQTKVLRFLFDRGHFVSAGERVRLLQLEREELARGGHSANSVNINGVNNNNMGTNSGNHNASNNNHNSTVADPARRNSVSLASSSSSSAGSQPQQQQQQQQQVNGGKAEQLVSAPMLRPVPPARFTAISKTLRALLVHQILQLDAEVARAVDNLGPQL